MITNDAAVRASCGAVTDVSSATLNSLLCQSPVDPRVVIAERRHADWIVVPELVEPLLLTVEVGVEQRVFAVLVAQFVGDQCLTECLAYLGENRSTFGLCCVIAFPVFFCVPPCRRAAGGSREPRC
jgi:hypothetical protein